MIDSLIHIDHLLFDFINQGLSNSIFDMVLPYVRNKKTWIPFYIIGAGLIIKFKGKQSIWIILLAIASVGLADLISSHFLKDFFARTRPCLLPDFSDHVNLIVERCSGAFSFPSSHAANHFALASFLALVFSPKKIIGVILLIWAGLISFSQVYVGVHFPSDVIVGGILGLIIGMLMTYIFKILVKKLAKK